MNFWRASSSSGTDFGSTHPSCDLASTPNLTSVPPAFLRAFADSFLVVTFLALLELLKDSLVEIVQSEEFGPIHIKGIDEVH